MLASRIESLQNKHEKLDEAIRKESLHAARDEALIEKLKKEKLQLKEEISRLEQSND